MSELRNRMIRDMQLAGLVKGTRREYLRAVRQLAAYYMISPDQLSERNVEDYILYVRDELGVAKGTFAPIFFGLKFFYLNTRKASPNPFETSQFRRNHWTYVEN